MGRDYLRELSIDELPGLTTPETTAIMLALCEALEMQIHFVAPAFGFQKNMPYPDNGALRNLDRQSVGRSVGISAPASAFTRIRQIWPKTTSHGRSHRRSLEIKTSGRYTYEMGRAWLHPAIRRTRNCGSDWHAFTG